MARHTRSARPSSPAAPPPRPPARPSARRTAAVAAATLAVVATVGGWVVYPEWSAARNLGRAKAALAGYDLPAAEGHLRRALDARPDHPEAAFLLAQVYRRTERYAEARAQLAAATRLGWVPEYVELEKLLLTVLEGGPSGPAEAKIRLYIDAAHPEDRLLMDGLTQAYLDSHFLTEALGVLDRWVERYPDDWFARFRRGEVREATSDGAGAVADFQTALDLRPDHPTARRRVAAILLEARKDTDEAVRLLEEQRARSPDDAEAAALLGDAMHLLGRPDDALRLADEALARQPDLPRALALKASLVRGTDPQTAFELMRRAEAARPDDPAAALALGQLAGQLGKADEAQRYLARHAVLEAEQERMDELAVVIRRRPHDPDVRLRIGRSSIAIGREKDALGWYLSALREDPNHAPTHAALAEYYDGPGRAPLLAARHRALSQKAAEKK